MKTMDVEKSLPIELQNELNKDIAKATHYSEEWYEWAKTIVEQLNYLRDDKKISNEDYKYIYNKYFKYIGAIGTLGEKESTEYLRFYIL